MPLKSSGFEETQMPHQHLALLNRKIGILCLPHCSRVPVQASGCRKQRQTFSGGF
jgi:hypothetical protein